jgi:hypothetical protein
MKPWYWIYAVAVIVVTTAINLGPTGSNSWGHSSGGSWGSSSSGGGWSHK